MYSIVRITKYDKELLSKFLKNAGNSLDSFRYFNKRSIEVLENHLITILVIENNTPVGYGHIDFDNQYWLGIAVSENKKGKGIGKLIMNELLNFTDNKKIIELHLTVDIENISAIELYKKFGFVIKESLNENIYLMHRNNV